MPAKTKALLMNPGAVFCWSFVPLAVRFLSSYCPALFQALFRYLAALIVLWSFTVITVGSEEARVGAASAALPVAEDPGYCSGELRLSIDLYPFPIPAVSGSGQISAH